MSARALVLVALVLSACVPDPTDGAPSGAGGATEPGTEVSPPPMPPTDTAAAPPDSVLVGDPPTWVPGPQRDPPAEWTTRTTHVAPRVAGDAVLRAVRAARHDGHDRIVFAFDGPLPGYHVEYVDRPAHACGSGDEVFLDGEAWLLVRFTPARAYTDDGRPTVPHGRTRPGLPVLLETALTCDFEGEVAFVLGLAAPDGYRVAELTGPARLAVDLRH